MGSRVITRLHFPALPYFFEKSQDPRAYHADFPQVRKSAFPQGRNLHFFRVSAVVASSCGHSIVAGVGAQKCGAGSPRSRGPGKQSRLRRRCRRPVLMQPARRWTTRACRLARSGCKTALQLLHRRRAFPGVLRRLKVAGWRPKLLPALTKTPRRQESFEKLLC